MAKKEEQKPMTIEDYNKLGIKNYAMGKHKDTYFITPLATKAEKLMAFPIIEDKHTVEMTKELYDYLIEKDSEFFLDDDIQ